MTPHLLSPAATLGSHVAAMNGALRPMLRLAAVEWGVLATPATSAITEQIQVNHTDKPTPIAPLPSNWSAFNSHEVLRSPMCRTDAAATLLRARNLRSRWHATISVEAVGRYRLTTFNTLILQTQRC